MTLRINIIRRERPVAIIPISADIFTRIKYSYAIVIYKI
ncbi:hypothetical protein SDC9_196446 [bioreactor metagenome]|uniref:Uncharacterized protein n=1 Tax=bioreactor metagenome TaxID=1076179 RepID=A0A645IKJ3_9ZZZZ